MEFRLGRTRGIFVPGAYCQTVITAKNAVADCCTEFARDLPLMFDRQIRNTAPRIEAVGCRKGVGGTDIKTFRAAATMVPPGGVMDKLGISEDHPQKQP